ncbi:MULTISPECIES: D-2-hydroxyacid dehydrogenase [unclassified Nocardiopsis]|uniref:D-2-hydroxyacid dehydrogenase n=1 Tax=Nocardiopsis TaxID=2013 RepID=UPI00387AA1DB
MSDAEVILVTGPLDDRDRERIRAASPGSRVEFADRIGDRPDLLPGAVVIAGSPGPEELARAGSLRWVHSWAAGVDGALDSGLADHPAVLTSAAGNGAVPLAEHAVLLMLMLDRDAPRWARAQREHRWDRFPHGELNGRTCGIIGLGNSGLDLAAKAKAFHMRVVGLRRRTDLPAPNVDRVHPPEELHALLAESDFVVVTAPLTPATAHLIGAAEFAAMKETAHIISISRGGIIDDAALLAALTERRIAGAGLDAHGVEPLPGDSPFWDLPNVIVTPHNGATTEATRRRGVDIFVDNLERRARGLPLSNVVDKAAGY